MTNKIDNLMKTATLQEDYDKIILTKKDHDLCIIQKCCDCGLIHAWKIEVISNEEVHLTVTAIRKAEELATFFDVESIENIEINSHETIRNHGI